jgi:FkbM family methyltransferase
MNKSSPARRVLSQIKVFDRPISQFLEAAINPLKLFAFFRAVFLIQEPISFLRGYLWFKTSNNHDSNKLIKIKTPVGFLPIRTKSLHDYVTIFEVFCRKDYRLRDSENVIIDVGSNIGISAVYFLSRRPNTHVVCYEPNPANLELLKLNMQSFQGRFCINNFALGTEDGQFPFQFEDTGRYGSLNISLEKPTNIIQVEVKNILTEILHLKESLKEINLIKIDTEGTELQLIEFLNKSHLKGYRIIAEDNRGGLYSIDAT